MPEIEPFEAIHPRRENAMYFTSPAYGVDTPEEGSASKIIFRNIKRAWLSAEKKINRKKGYAASVKILKKGLKEGDIYQDAFPCYYIYRQQKDDISFTGIIALTHIDDLEKNLIKKHELTRVEKESNMASYFQHVGVSGNPVLLTHEDNKDIDNFLKKTVEEEPEVVFTTRAGTTHSLWKIEDKARHYYIRKLYNNIPQFYIADGHHRCAAYRRSKGFLDSFMSFIIPANQLRIFSFYRIVESLPEGMKEKEFILKLKDFFEVEEINTVAMPENEGIIHLFMHDNNYKLTIPKDYKKGKSPSQRLDVSILEEKIIQPILKIQDSRVSKKISFVSSTEDLNEVFKDNYKHSKRLIFALYPLKIKDVFDIADEGETMPPKSTWIEPKLRGGLVIHKF